MATVYCALLLPYHVSLRRYRLGSTDDTALCAAPYRGLDAAERRRQQIQESKFLGGDMEHTHLVKGLDYALLQKVRQQVVVVVASLNRSQERRELRFEAPRRPA